MTTDCRCTLHPRKTHADPCRACASKHVSSARAAADRSNAIAATFEDMQPQLGERDNTRRGGANLRERAVPAVAPRSPKSSARAEGASTVAPLLPPRSPLGAGRR